ncbi:hypothetical protein QJS66_03885 [Kocuria rhizophila]|nr:hypothetical protein QJS66_03885 [Kocuria rhizophila]
MTLSPYLGFDAAPRAGPGARHRPGDLRARPDLQPEGASVQHVGGEDSVAVGILSAVATETGCRARGAPRRRRPPRHPQKALARHTDDRDQIATSAERAGWARAGGDRSHRGRGHEPPRIDLRELNGRPRSAIRRAGAARGRRRLGVLPGRGARCWPARPATCSLSMAGRRAGEAVTRSGGGSRQHLHAPRTTAPERASPQRRCRGLTPQSPRATFGGRPFATPLSALTGRPSGYQRGELGMALVGQRTYTSAPGRGRGDGGPVRAPR